MSILSEPLSTADYTQQLKQLLPKGFVWIPEADSVLDKTLNGLATELARVDGRACDLIEDTIPSLNESFDELLGDWERVAGSPDDCFDTENITPLERKRALVEKLNRASGQSELYFISLIEGLTGESASVTTYKQFQVGLSRAGDPLTNAEWVHTWQLNLPAVLIGSPVECVINKIKPAHTQLLFNYV